MYSYPYDVEWLLDNVSVRTDNNTLESVYWLNASNVAIHNVTARTNESQRTWLVNVTAEPKSGTGDFVNDTIISVAAVLAAGYFYSRFRRRF